VCTGLPVYYEQTVREGMGMPWRWALLCVLQCDAGLTDVNVTVGIAGITPATTVGPPRCCEEHVIKSYLTQQTRGIHTRSMTWPSTYCSPVIGCRSTQETRDQHARWGDMAW
jgi:hypothetical protein